MDLEGWHKQLASVSSEMSLALARRRMRRGALTEWIQRLGDVVTLMEEANERSGSVPALRSEVDGDGLEKKRQRPVSAAKKKVSRRALRR